MFLASNFSLLFNLLMSFSKLVLVLYTVNALRNKMTFEGTFYSPK